MPDVCPNCQKPVLATDVVCWHCGYQLPKARHDRLAGGQTPGAGDDQNRDARATDTPDPYDFRAIIVYGLLTLAVILGLLLVMHTLGRQPILVRNTATHIDGKWVNVTDANLRFTLSFPVDWQWLDVNWRDQIGVPAQLTGRQSHIGRALHPLGDAAGDVAIVAVALGPQTQGEKESPPFVVVGRSDRLRVLTPQAALDLLAKDSQSVTGLEIDTHLAGQTQARFTTLDNVTAYWCRHLFVTADDVAGYLVVACAPGVAFSARERELNEILDSFQLLER